MQRLLYLILLIPILCYAEITYPPPSDTTYGTSWDGIVGIAPSKNAVYDKLETILGDVTAVGDCATGACFDGTSDGGTYLDFYDAQGRTRLIGGNTASEVNITLPSTTGTLIHTEVDPTVDSSAEIQAIIGAGVYEPAGVAVADITDATVNGRSLISAANYAAMRGLLDLEAGTDFYSMSAADTAFEAELDNSAGLLAALNDETGTGLAVFGTLPTLLGAYFKNSDTSAGFLDIYEDSDDGTSYTRIQAVAQAGNITYSLPPDDGDAGEQLQTNGTGTLTWEAAAGAIAYDDIADPDAATTIVFDNDEGVTYESAEDTGAFLYLKSTDADLAGDTILLTLGFQQATDANQYYLQCKDNLADVPAIVASIGTDGALTAGVTAVTTINTGSGAMDLGDAAIANGDTDSIPTGDQVFDFCETTQDYLKTSELAGAETDPKVDTEAEIEAITGALFGTSKAVTSGYIWVADGTDFESVAMSGDVSIASGGATTVADESHAHTTTTISGLDISADTNLTAGRSLTLTGDDVLADAELYTDTKCIYWENPVATDDFKSIWISDNYASTITRIYAESDQTVTLNLQIDDGTPADVATADLAPAAGTATACASGCTTTIAAGAMASGNRLDMKITSVANTPTWCSVCWTFTRDD